MRRTERLFQIIQILRARRQPTTGEALAAELEVSLRTLYRDIAELMAQRVPIRGEAGIGYVIESDFDMPPLMLTVDELEAAVVGAAWVAQRGDASLARGARDLIAKLTSAVPENLRPVLLETGLATIAFKAVSVDTFDVSSVRLAIRTATKLEIEYRDGADNHSSRVIWPVALAYTEELRMIAAWCELRNDFRHFRTDRVRGCRLLDQRFPVPAARLRHDWKKTLKQKQEQTKETKQ